MIFSDFMASVTQLLSKIYAKFYERCRVYSLRSCQTTIEMVTLFFLFFSIFSFQVPMFLGLADKILKLLMFYSFKTPMPLIIRGKKCEILFQYLQTYAS